MPIWFICLIAETHRAPFDFREAESELVSGFNTEYSRANFAFLFLREYILVLIGAILIRLVFLAGRVRVVLLVIGGLVVTFVITWVRITFCRFRYDLLIHFA